jgi:hypothetical protein
MAGSDTSATCRRAWGIGSIAALVVGLVIVGGDRAQVATAAGFGSPSAFVPLDPQRLVDTRIGLGAPQQRVQAGTSIDIQVAGQLGVPADATAVVANITAVGAGGAGYLQVLPTALATPGSSSTVNVEGLGQTIPNAAFAPLGDGGRITVYATFTTDVVIDISGFFAPATASTSGRLTPVKPERILDTRTGLGHPSRVQAGAVVTLPVAGHGGVPAAGAAAVVMNVTAVDPAGPGYVQVAPTPVRPGSSSNLNIVAGGTIANLVVVPLAAAGTADLYTTASTDLVADVVGYFTDASAASSSAGLFVAVAPDRQLDSRIGATQALTAGTVTGIDVNDIAPNAIAIAGNVTATEPTSPGYLQLAGAPISIGASSNVNITHAGQTIANAAVSPVNAGQMELFNLNPTHELLDVTGYFTAALVVEPPVPPTPPTLPPPPTLPTVAMYEMNERAGATVLVDSSGHGASGSIGGEVLEATSVSGAVVHRYPYLAPNTPPAHPGHLDTVPDRTALDPGTSAYAVTMRARWTDSFGNMIQKGQSETPGGYFKWEAPNGLVRCVFRDGARVTRTAVSDIALNDGVFHTIRCERNAQGVTMTVDGVVRDTVLGATGSISNALPLSIAGKTECDQVDVTCDYFVGDIDWVRVEKG